MYTIFRTIINNIPGTIVDNELDEFLLFVQFPIFAHLDIELCNIYKHQSLDHRYRKVKREDQLNKFD